MIVPEVGELLPAAPTFDSEREAETEFITCGFRGSSGNFVEVIYIGDVDNKVLVAVPYEVWHRNSPRRKLGASLARAVLVGLAAASVEDRSTVLEEVEMKVWLGLMGKDAASVFELVTDRSTLDYAFGVDGNRGFLPHVRALAGVAWEQFQFVSAESAVDAEEEEVDESGAQLPNGEMDGMVENASELGPRVVALREPALKKAQVTSSVPELSESEEEEQEEESGGAGADAAPSVQTSLDRLTEIVSLLTAEQAKKMKASKVDQALDGVSAGTSLEAPSGGSSKRAAAARRILRQALLDHP